VEKDKKSVLIRYLVCFCVAIFITFLALWIKGFFKDTAKENMQVLHDAFFSAGALLMLFSGLLYVSGEGVFLGIGYALKSVARIFVPMSNRKMETYAEYRERKTGGEKPKNTHSIFFTGLFFFLISLIFLAIWYQL
jgi:hypothetical protein